MGGTVWSSSVRRKDPCIITNPPVFASNDRVEQLSTEGRDNLPELGERAAVRCTDDYILYFLYCCPILPALTHIMHGVGAFWGLG
jgi:hypothetical protein